MAELRDIAQKVRSKNAGPFWLTIDIFCGDAERYARIRDGLSTGAVAALLATPSQVIKRFDIPDLNVVKFSLPRPAIQGTAEDSDMHGAAAAALIGEVEIE